MKAPAILCLQFVSQVGLLFLMLQRVSVTVLRSANVPWLTQSAHHGLGSGTVAFVYGKCFVLKRGTVLILKHKL